MNYLTMIRMRCVTGMNCLWIMFVSRKDSILTLLRYFYCILKGHWTTTEKLIEFLTNGEVMVFFLNDFFWRFHTKFNNVSSTLKKRFQFSFSLIQYMRRFFFTQDAVKLQRIFCNILQTKYKPLIDNRYS
jgi:hypothetical protein